MDNVHDLIKLEGKRNAFLVVIIVIVIISVLLHSLISDKTISFDTPTIALITLLILGFTVFGAFTAYWSTLINRYNDLYGGKISASSSFKKMLSTITQDRVIIPYNLLASNENFREIYYDAVYSYFYSFPNASLPNVLRCLEVGLKEKYKTLKLSSSNSNLDTKFVSNVDNEIVAMAKYKKNPNVEDIGLFDWIEFAKDYYPKQKETLQYFRLLRNLIHDIKPIRDSDAQYALTRITEVLNVLYGLPSSIDIHVKCRICGNVHKYEIDSKSYYIGNKLDLECINTRIEKNKKAYKITVLPSRDKIH